MSEKYTGNEPDSIRTLYLKDIDPSPYQRRAFFDTGKLKELASSIQREGLIAPILVRCIGERYELIAGERRFQAIRDHTKMETIQAIIVIADDRKARRISAEENLQREDLTVFETFETIVDIVDSELNEDPEYASMGQTPVDRVKTLLGKLDSVRSSRERGSNVSSQSKKLFHKFMEQVEDTFKNLPKSLEWRSFYNNDLNLLVVICTEVRKASIQHSLNRSQIRALAKLKAVSESEFQGMVHPQPSANRALSDFSATEIEAIANKEIQQRALAEQGQARSMPSLSSEAKILLLARLGIPEERIAKRLKIDRKTVTSNCRRLTLFRSIRDSLDKGLSVAESAAKHGCPEPLVWAIELEGKSDQARFKALNWGLRTWDHWYVNDVDRRFGDDWPGRIPAQLVAHALFYFTREGDLVFDPMAGGGVVPDTCLPFHRKCWSFDLMDRPEVRPEIEPFRWNPENLRWPVRGKEKPDLIFFDPPYFTKMADQYTKDGVSNLARKEYLNFFLEFFSLAKANSKAEARIAFLNADWRDFQSVSAMEEDPTLSICIYDYMNLLIQAGWEITHIIDCPLSTQRFHPQIVSRMQKNRTLGVVRRSLIMGRKS